MKNSSQERWKSLTAIDLHDIREHLTIIPATNDDNGQRFDNLILTLELAIMLGKSINKGRNEVIRTARLLSEQGTVPQVNEKRDVIEMVQTEQFWAGVDVIQLEEVREAMRGLIRFLEKERRRPLYTDFTDEIVSWRENPGDYLINELHSYRKRLTNISGIIRITLPSISCGQTDH